MIELLLLLMTTGNIDNIIPVTVYLFETNEPDLWHYVLVDNIVDYKEICYIATEKTIGCSIPSMKIMFIKTDKAGYVDPAGYDVFTHEYIHARCDQGDTNWHADNNYGYYYILPNVNYYETCGR